MQHVTAEGIALVQQAEDAASNKVNIIFLLSTSSVILLFPMIVPMEQNGCPYGVKVTVTYNLVDNFVP